MSLRTAWALAIGLALCACGGDDSSQTDSGSGDDASVKEDHFVQEAAVEAAKPKPDAGFPGPHSAAPQVVDYGGAVLAAPNVVPIFFANDPFQTDTETFLAELASGTFWSSATSEYGVGPLTIAKSIVVTDAVPTSTTATQIASWLVGYLDGTHSEFPPIAPNNIYVVIYPSKTTITENGLGTSCVNFGGYHDETKSATNQKITYAVLPRCATFGTLTGLDAYTGPLSHELVEAATDPLPQTNTAWAAADQDHMVWNLAPLGEVGDMCAYEPQSYARILGTYVVQRPWSNASAKAGHDPCVPVLAGPYFNAAPVFTDTVTLDYYGQKIPTKGVQIVNGAQKTIDVQMFSDAPAPQWSVQAVDETYGSNQPQELDFAWDTQYGNNGDTLHLTITRLAPGTHGGTEFYIYAFRSQTTWNMWFGFVAN